MQETVNTLSLETERLRSEMAGLNRLADSFGQTMVRAFAGAIIHGRKLSDVLKGLALSLAGQALSSALKPLGGLLGNIFASAKGNVVTPFAQGGIVNSPTLFPLRGGAGLMGEAGAEAIMPLARGRDGKLGVAVGGGQAVNVTVNISTPDAASLRQSQSQIASVITRAVARGQRNL
ncbi:MAG: phage tail tape measure protein [Hyphomicrobiales bacterium]|nr:phage tail tape measure protein [Hyphomicrobiales bacterium]